MHWGPRLSGCWFFVERAWVLQNVEAEGIELIIRFIRSRVEGVGFIRHRVEV